MEPYYLAYEKRYKAVYEAGVKIWGKQPCDEALRMALTRWVVYSSLRGKKIIEFACGEGTVGTFLTALECRYHGFDVSPSAVARAKEVLSGYYREPAVSVLDLVNMRPPGKYDAALDVSGLHMIVVDADREKYLANMLSVLKPGAPALFFREVYREDAYSGPVNSFEQWLTIEGSDYETPSPRTVINDDVEYTVNIPLVPARGKNKEDYISEMTAAGFVVDDFVDMDKSREILTSASIYVHKAGVH